MITIDELIKKSIPDDIIPKLQNGRSQDSPNVNKIKSDFNPKLHKIVIDRTSRPDKKVVIDEEDEKGNIKQTNKTVPVARIPITLQELITIRAVAFAFGNDVILDSDPQNDKENLVFNAVKKVLYDNKMDAKNINVGRSIFGFTEVAEIWYPVENKNSRYGFDSKYSLKVQILTPENGDILYPYFDEKENMIAFSREFSVKDVDNNNIKYFETYTADSIYQWKQDNQSGGWQIDEGFPKPNTIKKIPVVYGCQKEPDYKIVQSIIECLETSVSNLSDKNAYHASPKVVTQGEIIGIGQKGDQGQVLEIEKGGSAQYLSWDQASESTQLELDTLLNFIYSLSQTPDISFNSVKGMGNISGIALKLLFMDAHMKVMSKKGNLIDYLQRRVNVILSFIQNFDIGLSEACQSIMIKCEIKPYIIEDENETVNTLVTANGGKPIISQLASVQSYGATSNPDKDYKQIQEETEKANATNLFEPTT